jgi:hypothetical protein
VCQSDPALSPSEGQIAEAGYIVISIDNRGTPAPRGTKWRKIYPNRTHSISEGPGTTPHIYKLIARYFWQNLPAGPR